MIKQLLTAVTLLVWGGPALADLMGIGRVGVLAGLYDVDLKGELRDANNDVLAVERLSQSRTSLGLLGGYTVAWNDFFGDLGLEYQSTSTKNGASFDRTDVLLSVGMFLPMDFNVSAGYRFGWQGEGMFDKEFYREVGPFVGVGFPSFGAFGDWVLSPSVAINFTKLKFDDSPVEPRFIGVSARGALSRPGSPHSFGLRVQRFSGDETEPEGSGSVKIDITEIYAHFFYQYSFLGMGQ